MRLIYTFLIFIILGNSQLAFGQCNFTISSNSVCGLQAVDFSVINPSGTYTWDFDGDGNTDATGSNVTHEFPQVDFTTNFSIALFRDNSFCQSQSISVQRTPDPTIGVLPGSGILDGNQIRMCSSIPNATLEIYNASSTYAFNVRYTINWGDGTIENFTNSTFPGTSFIGHEFNGFGYYNISIEVETNNGCINTGEYVFYNGGNPSVGMATPGNTTGLCAPVTVDFPITNTSNNPAGTIYNVYVSGELITTYTQDNIPSAFSYTFLENSCGLSTSTGNYQNAYDIKIEATNPCGSSQATIEPIEVSTPPELLFVIEEPSASCEQQEFVFSNDSGEIGEVTSGNPSTCTSLPPSWNITPGIPGVDWEVIEGNFFGSDEVTVIFYTPGVYTITMNVSSPSCGFGSISQNLEVFGNPTSFAVTNLVTAAAPGADECVSTLGTFDNESTGDSLSFIWNIVPSTGWNFEDTSSFTTEDILVNFTEPGDYTVSLSTSNVCTTEVWDTTLSIVAPPIVVLNPINDFCENATLNFDPSSAIYNVGNGTFSSIIWSFPGGTPSSFSGAYPTGIQYDAIGSYEVSVTATNQCGQSSTSQTFNIQDLGSVSTMPDQTVCMSADSFLVTASPSGGTWNGNGIDTNGIFTPSSTNVGFNFLTYTYQDNNCVLQGTTIIEVIPPTPVDAGPDQEACADGAVFLITGGTPTNGTWSVDNGGIIVGNNTFDPAASGAGVYTLTYNYVDGNGCNNPATKTIIVHELPEVNAGLDQSVCENPFDITLTGFTPAGGVWTGIGVSASGVFNAGNTPGLGNYTLSYSYTDPITNCENTDEKIMSVVPNDVAAAGANEKVCINETAFSITTGTPAGGTWSGPGIDLGTNIFDPNLAGVGNHVVTYTFGAGICETSDTKVIEVIALPNLTLPNLNAACINASSIDLTNANPTGGTWSGNGISGNIFEPSVAGIGIHTLTYTYTHPVTSCTNVASVDIEIFDLPTLMVNDTSYCNTPGFVDLPTTNPTGGIWSGSGVSGMQFSPNVAGGVGTYDLTYTFSDDNNCENTKTITATVIAPDDIDAGTDFEICIDADEIDLSQMATPVGGTWNSNGSAGLSGNIFNPFTAGSGIHTLTYTIGSGSCQVSDEVDIIIYALPVVNAASDFEVCADQNSVVLNAMPTGGIWTSNNGGDLNSNIFDAAISGAGNYSFTYTYTNTHGCKVSDDLLVTVNALPILVTNDTTYCNTSEWVALPYATPTGGTWSGAGVSANQFNPELAGGVGDYILTYTFTNLENCEASIQSNVMVSPPQPILAGTNDTLCFDQGNFTLSGYSPTSGGTWNGVGIVDEANGIFSPMLAGSGTHTLIYTYGNGSCFVQDFKTILVVDLSDVTAGPDESTCLTYETFPVTGNSPAGGIWSGNGIIDPVNGIFNPALAQVGLHTLTYTYTDSLSGCQATDEKVMTVFPMENPTFNAPDLVCRNEVVSFQNLSPADYTATWSFGDGNFSNDFSPTYAYDVVGIYEITLTVENEHGCVGTTFDTIQVTDVPVAYFTPDTSEACVGLELNVTNLSSGVDLSYNWNFGDNQNSSAENPGIIYFDDGLNDTTYIITLTTSNLCGSATFQDVITVRPLPKANIGLSPQTECSPLLMDFANISTGAATDFQWDFGNGNTSTDIVPETQTYIADSVITTYYTTLISSNICGSDTAVSEIIVVPPDVRALAGASELSGCQPLTIDFYNYSTPGAVIDWVFGDGNSSAQTEPTHTFTEAGSFTIIQYANSDCGYDTSTLQITVYPSPVVGFTNAPYACLNQTMAFENTSENTSGAHWDFGDGNTSTLQSPEHVYESPGEYEVTLTAVSLINQCPFSYTRTVTVLAIPDVNFTPDNYSGCVPFEINLTNETEETIFYNWDFGDGNTSIAENPNHLYSEVGTYAVTLIATDINGCFNDTTISNIFVHPRAEAAFDFSRASLCGLPAEINFINQSTEATAYTWNFDSGLTTPVNNPTNVYTEAGEYGIELIATNQFACADTVLQSLEIYPEPTANFEIENAEGCEPLSVLYNNTSTFSNNFYWDFGNGETSTEEEPTSLYENDGWYDVQLVVSIDDACFDTLLLEDLIQVYKTPFANFEVENVNSGINDGDFKMTNLSEDAVSYYWEFSDGDTSAAVNPTHRFLENGNKQILLGAISEYGCLDDTVLTFVPEVIKGLFIPNAFSPEQGLGDVRVFKPAGVGMKEYRMQIFSPYGQLIWESSELEKGQPAEAWDGTVNGKLMPQDVYVWKASAVFDDGTRWQGVPKKNGGYQTMGSVTLLR